MLATTNESADAEGPASFGSKFGTSVEHRDHSNRDNHVDLRNPFAERVAAAGDGGSAAGGAQAPAAAPRAAAARRARRDGPGADEAGRAGRGDGASSRLP